MTFNSFPHLHNFSYRTNVAKLSALMRLRRHHPMDDAIWLLEFIAKTGGAEHLRPSSRNLGLVEYLSLDVVAFLLVATWLAGKAVWMALAALCSCCKGRKGQEKREGKMRKKKQ